MARQLRQFAALFAFAGVVTTFGCGQAPPPRFELNMVRMAQNEVSDQSQQEVANVLAALFGTPDEPFATPEMGLDANRLKLAAGAAWRDHAGVSHGLYRRHCVHCHGITGDGRGPTARFLNPYPRDYRLGKFKFKSTALAARPTDADLTRVLKNGIQGTSMPAFSTLPGSELESLVEYVKYLSMRGEVETRLAQFAFNELGEVEAIDDEGRPVKTEDGKPAMERLPLDPPVWVEEAAKSQKNLDALKTRLAKEMSEDEVNEDERVQALQGRVDLFQGLSSTLNEELAAVVEGWTAAPDEVIQPKEEEIPTDTRTPEEIRASIIAGHELFHNTKGNCFSCHGVTALGDGQQTDFDDWMEEQKVFLENIDKLKESVAKAEEEDLDAEGEARLDEDLARLEQMEAVADSFYPLRNAIPRNLRKGIFRGGRRPIDVFHRVHQGIAGTKMPGLASTLTEKELWSIVDYVLSLQYEELSAPQPALQLNPEAIAN